MIHWNDEHIATNPVQKHIQMSFKIAEDEKVMAYMIAEDLHQNLNVNTSCVLVFVPTRKGTEEVAINIREALRGKGVIYYDKVDYYHAGLDAISREEKYEKYKRGDLVILVATKAFGMGMDIKNIHFIYHVGPSSTFEDFLQEVGRAGRDERMRLEAGFTYDKPIQAKCLMTSDDFRKIKDRQHNTQVTWKQIMQIRETIFDYLKEFNELKVDDENAFPLPLDLLETNEEYEEVYNKETVFRIALYWLEKLKRIRLGVYTVTHLPIRIAETSPDFSGIVVQEDRDSILKLKSILNTIKEKRNARSESESNVVMIDLGELKTKLNIKSTSSFFKLIFKSQKANVLILERNIILQITELRTLELQKWDVENTSLIIEAVFEFAKRLIELSRINDQISLEGDYLDNVLDDIQESLFQPQKIFWIESNQEPNLADQIVHKQKEDFIQKRSKFAFKIINYLPNIRHNSIIEIDQSSGVSKITQLIYNSYTNNTTPLLELEEFKTDLIRLIRYVANVNIKNNIKLFNLVDLIVVLDLEDKSEDYIQSLIFIAKWLGYLKGRGDLVPMGIELFVKDLTGIDGNEEGSTDNLIRQELIESHKMKELRLLALECLSKINIKDQDHFIKKYFQCKGLGDLVSILEEEFGEDNPLFKAYREEALKQEQKKLNPSQLAVYNADIGQNLQVIAGPGTGKTHTLTLRVARLIQEERISPDNILILAYNRAVVIELKSRLSQLFKELGYSSLIRRLKVHTFHSFIKYCIPDRLKDLDFKEWTSIFLETLENTPGLVTQRLGNIQYVFVDEFQDITTERLNLLKSIAPRETTKICVIGDPNQSIYGYERAAVGGPMDPTSDYADFNNIYAPKELFLKTNYRSFPQILDEADKLLSLNISRYKMPKLEPFNKPESTEGICEVINLKTSNVRWESKLSEIIQESSEREIKQIALMFRSNAEVFRAFNKVQSLRLDNVRLRIQGSSEGLYKTREFHFLLSNLIPRANQRLDTDYIRHIKEAKENVIAQYSNWDEFILNIFHCLVLEFDKNKEEFTTYADLVEFIKDIASKDDSQFGKIYEKHIHKINPHDKQIELVFTTMHKVKGLEFDAVLIPPSFSNLPLIESPATNLEEIFDEERRLYYVAYTRAKKKLVIFKYNREINLEKGEVYQISEQHIETIGLKVDEGINKFTLYWSASKFGNDSFNFINESIKIGDKLSIKYYIQGQYTFWYVEVNGKKIAQLSLSFQNIILNYCDNVLGRNMIDLKSIEGLNISAIYTHTYQETLNGDERNNKTNFAENWTNTAKERGYIYLIDFSGYAKFNF